MTAPAPAPPAPHLSVLLVTPDRYDCLRCTVAHLTRQTIRERLELVLVAPSRDEVRPREDELACFAAWQVVEVGPLHSVGRVRAAGVRRARAPLVAFGEDHSFPEPGWAEALVTAHAAGWAAVGPVLVNENPRSAVSWGALFAGFAPWVGSPPGGPVDALPWHNSAYRRAVLLACGPRLEALLEVEALLQAELRARGHRLYLEPAARTRHLNISRPAVEVAAELTAGRHFALGRRREGAWSPLRRAVAALAAPAAVPLRAARLVPHVRRVARAQPLPRGTWAAIGLSLAAHALGEVAGALLGEGRVLERRADFEFRRGRFLRRGEAAALEEPASWFT